MQVNYCAIVEPMTIYPDDLRQIMVLLDTVLFPTGTVNQFLMKGITDFMREKLEEYDRKQEEEFSSMCVGTWTTSAGKDVDLETETNTEVTLAKDFPYASEEEKKEIQERSAKKVAKKVKRKAK